MVTVVNAKGESHEIELSQVEQFNKLGFYEKGKEPKQATKK